MYFTIILLTTVGALITYKGMTALSLLEKVHATGVFQPRANVLPLVGGSADLSVITRSINYLLLIWPAFFFGVLISATVQAFAPSRWLARALGGGRFSSQLVAGLAGTPLMLCSCCVAPIFTGVYERSRCLGPSLTLMLAAPSLNPVALTLTFMLFDGRIAAARLVMSLMGVFLIGLAIERLLDLKQLACPPRRSAEMEDSGTPSVTAFLRTCAQVAARTVPSLIAGVMISMVIAQWLPMNAFSSPNLRVALIVIVALIATLLALPTFFELPLAAILLATGAPAGAAVAMLIAGPAVNLPSLLTVARSTSWKVAMAAATAVWLLAVAGGLMVG